MERVRPAHHPGVGERRQLHLRGLVLGAGVPGARLLRPVLRRAGPGAEPGGRLNRRSSPGAHPPDQRFQ
ncbi:hypothetical protein SGPA1_10210 [Streptomyces misionensis JCM 4497]